MDHIRWNEYTKKFINIFSKKRLKATLYMAAVLWVAVVAQVVVNRVFREEAQITEAFIKSDTRQIQSGIEMIAEYQTDHLSDNAKKELIQKIADSIGLTVVGDISLWEDGNRSEYFYFKQAKQATTEIKVVSIAQDDEASAKMKYYIIVRLNLLQGIESIDQYKKLLEDTFEKLPVENTQVTLKYEGNREGDLSALQKHDLATRLVDELQGKIALEYDEGDLYTVYAYTGMINEYITSMGNKINIQIAITYNELTNTTKISLATPVNNDSW